MQRWMHFDLTTGRLSGRTVLADDRPEMEGCGTLELQPGQVLRADVRRVNPRALQIEAVQPPKPQADELRDWAWDPKAERWLAVPTLAARKAELRTPLLQQLADEDARVVRPLLEVVAALAAGGTPPAEARVVLQAITARKDALRGALQAIEQADSAPLLEAAATRRQGLD